MAAGDEALLSVIVAIVSDTTSTRARSDALGGCLEALQGQTDAPPMEVIVPHHPNTDGLDALKVRFPAVRFIAVTDPEVAGRVAGSRDHHDTLRARGLAAARGGVLALLEDHGRPDAQWATRLMAAHRSACAAVGGAIENGIDRPLNWGVYFCDFSRYQNPLPAGPSSFVSDANAAYKRSALESVRRLWATSFKEVVINAELIAGGGTIVLDPRVVVYQHRVDLRLGAALRERFVWGRSYATTRSGLLTFPRRMLYAALSPVLPLVMMQRMAAIAWRRHRHFAKFLRAAPLVALLACSWSAGELAGYLAALPQR